MPFLLLAQPADGIQAATVIRWLKRPGDRFAAGEGLVELETEEAVLLMEAAEAGTLAEILAQPGSTLTVGAKLARIESAAAAPQPVQPINSSSEKRMSAEVPSGAAGKVVPILMPQAGNTMEEGTVLTWRVQQGDQIEVGQVICEIETDKATIDFESPNGGRLARIVAAAGQTVPVKEPIALLADNDADVDAYLGQGKSGAPDSGPVPELPRQSAAQTGNAAGASRVHTGVTAAVTNPGRVKASPAARKIAAETGVALASVAQGSGPGGRVLSSDVTKAATGATPAARPTSEGKGGERRTPMSKMRRAIGLNLQASKQTVPHFYVRTTIDADPLLAFYRQQKPQTSCTLNDVVVLAVGRAMREFPAVRSQIVGNDIIEFPHANIGVAVGVEDGLVVPVVLNVDTLSLTQLAAETKRVVESSRKGKLENLGKGNFTISNLGMFGVDEFSAIINPPESGILAVGAIRESVMVANGAIRAGRTMTMTLSADHRIVDGVIAAQFMARLKELLENLPRDLV